MCTKAEPQKLHIMLHDDWEIYGDGTGSPQELMFDPAKRLLDICDKYGAKYTFYAEIGQQYHMLNASDRRWRKIAVKWENILKEAVSRGHDVQLHFHPQWMRAELKNGRWKLDFSNWHSGTVRDAMLERWIHDGKQYLEKLLKSVNKNYKVVSFRAGGWMCQPSDGLYKALEKNGIPCDVTVRKGRYIKYEDGSFIDFRKTVSKYEPWKVNPNDFTEADYNSDIYMNYLYLPRNPFFPSLCTY